MVLGGYGHCVRALLIGEVLPYAWGCPEVYAGGCFYTAHVTLKCGQRKCISFVVITMCCVSWVYVRTNCVQAVVQREKTRYYLRYIELNRNRPEIQTPCCNYNGSYRGALKIMILV